MCRVTQHITNFSWEFCCSLQQTTRISSKIRQVSLFIYWSYNFLKMFLVTILDICRKFSSGSSLWHTASSDHIVESNFSYFQCFSLDHDKNVHHGCINRIASFNKQVISPVSRHRRLINLIPKMLIKNVCKLQRLVMSVDWGT